MTQKEKRLWNEAVRATLNEVYMYDGIIPDEEERKRLWLAVGEKVSYKEGYVPRKFSGDYDNVRVS